MKLFLAVTSLFFLTYNCKLPEAAFCNWDPDGSGGSSVCEGGAQGGAWCNESGNHCESSCGGRWCTSSFCNWFPDGSGASSSCEGGVQGGEWCNTSGDICELNCGGRWCTSAPPIPPTSVGDGECPPGWNQASWTTYTSYAPCCKDSPNYDPSADTTECDLYSACDYLGQFAYMRKKKSLEWVKRNNIAAFFSSNGDNASFRHKQIRVSAAGKTVEVRVVDTCGDSDCNGCCSSNADPSGYLLDMEFWTVVNNFGDISAAQWQICWQLV
jgi:hypothetical protein